MRLSGSLEDAARLLSLNCVVVEGRDPFDDFVLTRHEGETRAFSPHEWDTVTGLRDYFAARPAGAS